MRQDREESFGVMREKEAEKINMPFMRRGGRKIEEKSKKDEAGHPVLPL